MGSANRGNPQDHFEEEAFGVVQVKRRGVGGAGSWQQLLGDRAMSRGVLRDGCGLRKSLGNLFA